MSRVLIKQNQCGGVWKMSLLSGKFSRVGAWRDGLYGLSLRKCGSVLSNE